MDKYYYELTIKVEKNLIDFILDLVSTIFNDAIEIKDDTLILRGVLKELEKSKEALEENLNLTNCNISREYKISKKENIDWINRYKESIKPILVSSFFIHPSWHKPKENAINITIDPALAFGSGHHATTLTCIEILDKYVKEDDNLLDVGCGSGILGLIGAKLKAKVSLCDTDPLAIKSTKENFILNNESYKEVWEGSIDKAKNTYNIIIANIIADILKILSNQLENRLEKGGVLILSGILEGKETGVKEAFSSLTLKEEVKKDEWITLVFQN